MILHKDQYVAFIEAKGVGKNDRVASSSASYVSYLNGVASLLGEDITPSLLRTEGDILAILRKLDGQRSANTVRNYGSAMRRYVEMVQEHRLT